MIELLKQPDSLSQMSIGDKLTGVLEVAGLGIGVTFVVLLLLMLCITILTKASTPKATVAPVAAVAPAVDTQSAQVAAQQAAQAAALAALELEEEICAIFASITAMEQGNPVRIVNIVPLDTSGPWVEGVRLSQFSTRGSQLK